MAVPEYYCKSDIAKMTRKASGDHLTRQAIDDLERRGKLPNPDAVYGIKPRALWLKPTVLEWLSDRERRLWG